MNIAESCKICGAPSSREHTCKICGSIICENCSREDICSMCIDRRIDHRSERI